MGPTIINFGPNAGTEDDLTDHRNFFPLFRTTNHNFSRMGHFRFRKNVFFAPVYYTVCIRVAYSPTLVGYSYYRITWYNLYYKSDGFKF